MTVEYLRYTVDASRQGAFVDAYVASADALMASPWCRSFELCRCDEDPATYVVRIEWTSAEDHLQRFRRSEAFRSFFARVGPYVDDIDEMRHYTSLERREAS